MTSPLPQDSLTESDIERSYDDPSKLLELLTGPGCPVCTCLARRLTWWDDAACEGYITAVREALSVGKQLENSKEASDGQAEGNENQDAAATSPLNSPLTGTKHKKPKRAKGPPVPVRVIAKCKIEEKFEREVTP
jgi:hypothetical protein